MQRVYRSRQRQLLLAASIVALYIATFSVVLEPDPVSHTMIHFGTYVWQLVPFAILTAFFGWRAFKVRVVTTPDGLGIQRVASREFLPWSTVRGFEVHPTPSGRLVTVVVRRTNGRIVKLKTFWVRSDGMAEAEAMRVALETDRAARIGAGTAAGALA